MTVQRKSRNLLEEWEKQERWNNGRMETSREHRARSKKTEDPSEIVLTQFHGAGPGEIG
jgi:hypothetical protein